MQIVPTIPILPFNLMNNNIDPSTVISHLILAMTLIYFSSLLQDRHCIWGQIWEMDIFL